MVSITLPNPPAPAKANSPGEPGTTRRPRRHDWDSIAAELRENPGVWLKAAENFSGGMFSYLRQNKIPSLWMGGTLEATRRDTSTASQRGTLWLRWQPDGWTEADQDRVDEQVAAGEGVL
jgi:hypothetical protein